MRRSLALIGTITAGATLLQTANGLLQALLPLRMQAEGLSISAIGVVAACYGLGFATGCFLAPPLIRHVGHIRAFVSLAALSAVMALLLSQAHALPAWCALRFVSGLTLAGLFTVIDGWVSARASASHRGRIVSLYTVCTRIALMLSPLGIGLGSIAGDGLFMAISIMMSLSLLPLSATATEEPATPRSVRVDLPGLFAAAPSAAVAAFAAGLMNGPVVAVATVFGTGIGLSGDRAAALLFALQAGSLIAQWPVGWISDHSDRRHVIGALALGSGLTGLLVLWAVHQSLAWLAIVGFGLFGATSLCIYSVCVAHACDVVPEGRIVPTIGGLLALWAAGSTLGPIPGSAMMQWLGPGGLFIYQAAVAFGLAAFVAWRVVRLARQPKGEGFVDLAPTSTATATMSPRA